MRIAYIDAFAGVSGDMLLGAFIQAGAPVDVLRDTLRRLSLGATLQYEETDRSGISAIKANILVGDVPAEIAGRRSAGADYIAGDNAGGQSHANGAAAGDDGHDHDHHHSPDHEHGHAHSHAHAHEHTHAHTHEPARESAYIQRGASEPTHSHGRAAEPERTLGDIQAIIAAAKLPARVAKLALETFDLLAAAESKVHRVPVEKIHFHEVGAVDAIADIVLAAAAADALAIEAWYCSPLNVGGGSVQCAHGRFPVPAPAVAELLRGVPTYSSGIQMELVTPTGAALVRAFPCAFGSAPHLRVRDIGYGAGTRNPSGFANVLRLSIGDLVDDNIAADDTVLVLEAAVDDLNPQVLAYVTERALKAGALDVMCTPVYMKKGRPGTLLTMLADRAHAKALEELILTETSTLGLRMHEERRVCLSREYTNVKTEWGDVRIKIGHRNGREYNAAPEFEDCRALAEARQVPVKRVLEAALHEYRKERL